MKVKVKEPIVCATKSRETQSPIGKISGSGYVL